MRDSRTDNTGERAYYTYSEDDVSNVRNPRSYKR